MRTFNEDVRDEMAVGSDVRYFFLYSLQHPIKMTMLLTVKLRSIVVLQQTLTCMQVDKDYSHVALALGKPKKLNHTEKQRRRSVC